jgi:protein gp37
MPSRIEWTDETWNPITGCTPISEGCDHCYAQRMAKRLAGRYGYPDDDPFRVTFHSNRLGQPLKWKKPRRVFVCSMGDLFHPGVSFAKHQSVFSGCYNAPQHTYLFLTKRPRVAYNAFGSWLGGHAMPRNWWVGVTAENQARADKRIPVLLEIPAAVRFVSVEPMLGPVDIKKYLDLAHADDIDGLDYDDRFGPWRHGLNWVICGGETGPGARTMRPEWARSLRGQCQAADVPFFFKKMGGKNKSRLLDGETWDQYPEG